MRPSGIDGLGRLTSVDVAAMTGWLSAHGVPASETNLDLAAARSNRSACYGIIVVVRNGELPTPDVERSNDSIAGFLVGHSASPADRNALAMFRPVSSSARLFDSMTMVITGNKTLSIVDAIANLSRYNDSSMTAFLLRKLQSSWYGHRPVVIAHDGYRIDGGVGRQMVKFGFHVYGAGAFDALSAPVKRQGPCAALMAFRVHDSREGV